MAEEKKDLEDQVSCRGNCPSRGGGTGGRARTAGRGKERGEKASGQKER